MKNTTDWLAVTANLNVYRAKHGPAPHKPLLLLVVLEMSETGELPPDVMWLTPELSFRFDCFWDVVAHRRTQPPDVRLPFHHLSSDGFWHPFADSGKRSTHRSLTRYVQLDAGFVEAIGDPRVRNKARRILIAKYFQPAERNALYHLTGIPIPSDDEIARDANFEAPKDAAKAGREGRFRVDVVSAYNYTCALTGYRVTTIASGTIVDGAHIHQFSDSRNNNPGNGIALCKNAHWLFDAGLWSLDDDYRIIVALGAFTEASPHQKPLSEFQGEKLRLPERKQLWPDQRHISWHRKHKFQAE